VDIDICNYGDVASGACRGSYTGRGQQPDPPQDGLTHSCYRSVNYKQIIGRAHCHRACGTTTVTVTVTRTDRATVTPTGTMTRSQLLVVRS